MATPASPSYAARSQAQARLASVTLGFNPNYAATASNYPGAPATMGIDFTTGAKSLNFFQGKLRIEDILETGTSKFPLMAIYAIAGANNNRQKFQKFSGLVRVGIDVHLSYNSSQALRTYEAWPDAVEDAMIVTFNQSVNQNWPSNIAYNGELSFDRGTVIRGGQNWLQSLSFKATFEAIIT